MNNWSFYDNVTALIPFNLKGKNGKVSVYYGVNDDPIKVGFDVLPGIPFDINVSRGYPVINARIEDYAGSGYRMFCGWIQIVTSVYLDSRDSQNTRSETFISADIAPALLRMIVPLRLTATYRSYLMHHAAIWGIILNYAGLRIHF